MGYMSIRSVSLRMKNICAGLARPLSLLLLLVLVSQTGTPWGETYAYVDVQKVLLNSHAGVKAKGILAQIAKGYEETKKRRKTY